MMKKFRSIDLVYKILAFILFCVYLAQEYVFYAIDNQQVFPAGVQILMFLLRWTTIVTTGLAVIVPFFGGKHFKTLLCFLGPIVAILNLILFKQNMIAWGSPEIFYKSWDRYGSAYVPWRAALFIVEQILILLISAYTNIKYFKEKEYKSINVLTLIGVIVGLYLSFAYQPLFNLLFGEIGEEAKDFSVIHRISLSLNLFFILISYIVMNNKDKESKDLFFAVLSCSGVFNFFYYEYGGLASLPLHLCNTAIIMMFVAFIFKMKGMFYFTYFVNVIGALFAMLFPNISGDVFSHGSIRFWYNHIYAFCIPILGVCLKVYERPTIKLMGKAIFFFSLYFVIVIFFNLWFSNYAEVDYFFVNSFFLVDKLGISRTLMTDHQIVKNLSNGLVIVAYPLFYLLVYVVYIGLMFVMWFIYDFLYKVADSHRALHKKKMFMKIEKIKLKDLAKNRSLQDPLYEEYDNMIEIKDFTKIYSGSNKPSVDGLNLTIPNGCVYGFLGHNGAGKSTTIKSIVGIQSITSGQIIVEGYDVSKQPVEAKLRIGYVSDNHAVYERLTGREYINYIADLYLVSKDDREERIAKYTKMFKLEDAIDNEIKSYSHGMKQKIVVIASLIHDPKVWILDEPLTGLDPTSAYQIKECMRDHANRGNIVFFSSHVIEVVEKVCDNICIISHGKLQCEYSLKELHEKNISLEDLYLKYVTSEEKIS